MVPAASITFVCTLLLFLRWRSTGDADLLEEMLAVEEMSGYGAGWVAHQSSVQLRVP